MKLDYVSKLEAGAQVVLALDLPCTYSKEGEVPEK